MINDIYIYWNIGKYYTFDGGKYEKFSSARIGVESIFILSKDMACIASEPAYISYVTGYFWPSQSNQKRKVGIYLGDSLIYGVEKSERAILLMTESGEILPIEVAK